MLECCLPAWKLTEEKFNYATFRSYGALISMASGSLKLTLVLGTSSVLKIRAVKGAFSSAREKLAAALGASQIDLDLVTTNPSSGVNEQPFGWEEIILGANNRTRNALKMIAADVTPRLSVAIENGVVPVTANGPDFYMDIAWVILNDLKTGKQYATCSTGVTIPAEIVKKAQEDFKHTTIGDVLHSKDSSISAKDPHSTLLGGVMTRVPLMEQAILTCMGQWIHDLQSESLAS